MKSLSNRKFNPIHTTLLLSSVLISPMAMAEPVKNKVYHVSPTLKLQRTEIKKLKEQITQIQQQHQQKINELMARLDELEKSTQEEEKKLAQKAKETSKKKAIKPISIKKDTAKSVKKEDKNKAKEEKQVVKNHLSKKINTDKNNKKELEKTKANKKQDTKINKEKPQNKPKKKGKKVLGADEISVEQLDLAKLSAGAKIETIHKPIKQEKIQPKDLKIETIVKNDNEPMLQKRKPRILKVKRLNLNNKKFNISAQKANFEQDKVGSKLYLKALKAFSDKNTDVAIRQLKQYVNNYPNGKLVPKAKYWLGESYLQKEPADYATARYYFLEVVDKHEHHPQNNKKSKALYRLSQLSKINNYDDELKKYTDMLKKKYPNTKETKLALELLKK